MLSWRIGAGISKIAGICRENAGICLQIAGISQKNAGIHARIAGIRPENASIRHPTSQVHAKKERAAIARSFPMVA